jgi:hypothetical protein
MAGNIDINDVVSLGLDQLACISYQMQLRFLILHVCTFLRQFSKAFFDRLAATVNSRCGTESIFRLFLMSAVQAPEPSLRGKNPHRGAAARVSAQHQLRQVFLQHARLGETSLAELPPARFIHQFPVILQDPRERFINKTFAFARENSRGQQARQGPPHERSSFAIAQELVRRHREAKFHQRTVKIRMRNIRYRDIRWCNRRKSC